MQRRNHFRRRITLVLGLAALIVLPQILPTYYTGLLTEVLIYGIFAMGFNLLLGYTGLPSLGFSAHFGSAAYAAGIMALNVANNFWLDASVGLLVSVTVAAIYGVMSLRASGGYFLMITLALGQIVWGIAFGWRSMTGGDDGLPGIPRPHLGFVSWSPSSAPDYFYFALVIFIVAAAALYVIVNSPFGHALKGIRESEVRMNALGYNVWLYQYAAFVISALFAGVAGVLFVFYTGFVSTTELSIRLSAEVMLMVILGGAGTLWGPIVGTGFIVLLRNIISAYAARWILILGILYVLVVLFAPHGILGTIQRKFPKRRAV
jgi:branched-chain amino acid transport system permease protein